MPKQSVEKYKENGLVQLSTWVSPETLKKIKTIAFLEDKMIRTVIEEKFSDIHVDIKGKGNKVTINFARNAEVVDA